MVGHELTCVPMFTKPFRGKPYIISSPNKIRVLTFIVFDDGEKISMFCGQELSDMVISVFGIEYKESVDYIRDWFGDTHNLNKVSDILKFIPEKSSTV